MSALLLEETIKAVSVGTTNNLTIPVGPTQASDFKLFIESPDDAPTPSRRLCAVQGPGRSWSTPLNILHHQVDTTIIFEAAV